MEALEIISQVLGIAYGVASLVASVGPRENKFVQLCARHAADLRDIRSLVNRK